MERKLAHVELVDWVRPIEGADRIEVCGILGWECVIKKGEFKPGDKVIYVEVDSVMPDIPQFEFLRDRKFRIRTIKLRKQVSQGLVLPLNTLSEINPKVSLGFINVGDDVTEYLGVTKYLSPSEKEEFESFNRKMSSTKNPLFKYMMRFKWFRKIMKPKKTGGWPQGVSKTDEDRIQSMPRVLEKFADTDVYITEKIDYQSTTYVTKKIPSKGLLGKWFKKNKFTVCSRNHPNNNKSSLYWTIAKKYEIQSICNKIPGLVIQGEQGDTKVQGNKYKISKPRMWVFNIINNGYHYDYDQMLNFCNDNKLEIVPLVFKGKLKDFATSVPEIVEKSKGKSVVGPTKREGIVVRSIKDGKKILSFKVINPDFLLKYD